MPRCVVRILPVLCALLFGLGIALAHAQTSPLGEGTKGWCTTLSITSGFVCFATPMDACREAHDAWTDGRDTPYTVIDDPQRWWQKRCDWCYGNMTCGFLGPGYAFFNCEPSYDGVSPGSCAKHWDPVEQVAACTASGGAPNPATAHPILILTGAKLLAATDFATADGDLVLQRSYRSLGGAASVDAPVRGLGLGWRFSFQHELAIDPSFASNGRVTLKTADGAAYDFARQADGIMAPVYNGLYNAVRNADYRLAFDGPWPADLSEVVKSRTRWRLDDPQGRSWMLESFDQPGLVATFTVARPVSLSRHDGYVQSFGYGVLNELQSLTDSFGRQIAFTWAYGSTYSNSAPVRYPIAIAAAALPGGTTIRYAYEPLAATGTVVLPERLVTVSQVDAQGQELERTTYLHEDARFPAHVTGITDARGVRTLTVAYDGRGRAVSSELAGGAERMTVAYGEATAPVTTRTVTNALGKQTVYRFRATGYGAFRLEGVDGLASANCAGSTTSYGYDANGWVVSETDAEGRRTTYVRDLLGRPATITRAGP